MANKLPIPTEATEEKWLFEWAAYESKKYPELELMYHVPNEGKRNPWTGAQMVQEGLKKGVPDIFLPAPKNGYHGLYIELKRQKGGKLSEAQAGWIERLTAQGYQVAVCMGFEAAKKVILEYLRDEK